MSDFNPQNTALEQRLCMLTERTLHKQHLIQATIDEENKRLEVLVAALIKCTEKPDSLGAYNRDLLAMLNSTREAVEASLNRLRTLQNDIISMRKEITQIRLLSIVSKLRKESTRDMNEDLVMAEIINKASLLVLSYVDTMDATTGGTESNYALINDADNRAEENSVANL
ncbi:hypothetical protein F5878DRAFT_722287 [Lentinula raphanica]|uniref:Uncharacterized protein n=1 Tax=Lentinula raphanica TaxID=153919 RepID=A0AA38PGQ3_9AGAR|nr:hypothetical protein F5878DRAFT_722287 [Lentinula raphanica]